MAPAVKKVGKKQAKKPQEKEVPTPQPAAASTPEASSSQQQPPRKNQEPPKLPPYMRDTVAMRLKEVDGRVPDMSKEVFCKKMLLDQGVHASDIFGIQAMIAGLFYVTFVSVSVCKRYWEAVKTAAPDSPFHQFVSNCLLQREERRITVSMWNLRTPGEDIFYFLHRYCTVVKGPSKVLNCYGVWMGKWTATVLLAKDPQARDGLRHLPQSFSLGNSHGLIYYPDMPQTCRKCGKEGHVAKDCKEDACRNCRVTGHQTKDCPRASTCNLCGQSGHVYKTCSQRTKTWAEVAASAPSMAARTPAEPKQKQKVKPTPEASRNAAKLPEASSVKQKKPGKTKKVTPSPCPSQPTPTPLPTPLPTPTSPPSLAEIATTSLATISDILSPAPMATLPPNSPGGAVLTTSSPTASPLTLTLTEQNFPPLSRPPSPVSSCVSPGNKQRKRKQRDSPVADSTKRKLLEETVAQSPVAAEMEDAEDYLEELQSVQTEYSDLPGTLDLSITEQQLDAVLAHLPEIEPTNAKEKPPDGERSYSDLARRWTHGPSYWSGGGSCKSAGTAILFRGGAFTLDCAREIVCGRLLVVDGSWAGEPVRFISVYAPPDRGERLDLFQRLRPQLATTRAVVLAGDFNCPVEQDGRSSGSAGRLDITSKLLVEMVSEASLRDAVGAMGSGSANYTWSRPDGSLRSRIDFVFTSRAVRQCGHSMVPCFFSDHRAVRVQGALGNGFPPGPGSWKLNCALLEDEAVRAELRDVYTVLRNDKCLFATVSEWWEHAKVQIRCFFQDKGRRKAAKAKRDFGELQRQLRSLQDLQRCGWSVRDELEETKKSLKEHFEEESRRIIFRSKVTDLEKGEKCNSFFFRKVHAGHTPLNELRDENGSMQKGKEEVMGVVKDFYSSLYSPKHTDDEGAERFLAGITNPLDPAGSTALNAPLTVDELLSAASSFRPGRTPGTDGLPAELYTALGDLIGPDLLEVFEEMAAEGKMPPSLREGMITLLYKRKGERCDLKNWRPISLLNVDYKILAKVLANRLKAVIGRIVHRDQTCGIPGRRIADSLALLRDTVHYIGSRNVRAALVSLDQEKAFDRVSHGFLGKALRKFGLGETFCSYVNLMYLDIRSTVLVNGWKTDPFPVLSGVRQGCPLSPLLFVCVIELFAESIRQNREIRGITAPGPGHAEVKCSLYMDDVTIFCADRPSVTALVQTCEDFSQASGAKVNCRKSEAMLFGDWQLASSAPFPFTVQRDYIKILGIWFGKEGAALKSWQERLAKANQKIALWSHRQLSLEGKKVVLCNQLLPVLQYTAQAWPPLAAVSKAITRAIFHFVWGSKMDRVKRAVMFKDPAKGGKGIPDISTLLWIHFVCDCVRRTLRTADTSAGRSMSRFFLLPLWRGLGWDKWDNSFPYNWTAPWYYSGTVRFVRDHHLEGLKPDLWKPKTIHKLIRAKDFAEDVPGLTASTAATVWANVCDGGLFNRHKDLSWMAIQGGLPLRSFMHDRGLSKTRYCPRCPYVEETSLHLFWECPFARALLDALDHELMDSVPRNTMTCHAVLYGLFQGTHTVGAIQDAWRLMNCFKDAIWCARRLLTFNKETLTTQDCHRLVLSHLRDYALRDSLEAGDQDEEEGED